MTYSADGHSYDEDEFNQYGAFKPYVIQESDGDTEPAEKADFQLIEAHLKKPHLLQINKNKGLSLSP
ncbi:MAG: hypothetical protein ACLTZN_01630 [Streptococcus sp.]